MKLAKKSYRNRGEEIAKILWPELTFEPDGSFWNQYGIDGYIDSISVQIKFDGGIPLRHNLWHEIYEKSANHPEQPWRKSPGNATHYIFTSETINEIIGILIPVDTLAKMEISKELHSIRPNKGSYTSCGFSLPYEDVITQLNVQLKLESKYR